MSFDILKILILFFCIFTVFQDLRTRKVTNTLIVCGFFSLLIARFYIEGFNGVLTGFFASTAVLLTGYFLWQFKVLGAGDVKVMTVVGLVFSWERGLEFIFYSFAWGALLGLISLFLAKSFFIESRLVNYNPIMSIRNPSVKNHKVPFTVAILVGLLSTWVLSSAGVYFL